MGNARSLWTIGPRPVDDTRCLCRTEGMLPKGLARWRPDSIELSPRTPLGESGATRRRGSTRRGNPPQQPGDAGAGTGVEELSIGSITGPVNRRALVAHTCEGPSPISARPDRQGRRGTGLGEGEHRIQARPQVRTPSCGNVGWPCGRRGPDCGRHADRREIPEIVGDSPCAGAFAGHRTSLTFSSGRTGSAGKKIRTTGQLVAVAG